MIPVLVKSARDHTSPPRSSNRTCIYGRLGSGTTNRSFASILAAPVLCNGSNAEVSEELGEGGGGGQVVGVEATGIGKNPSVAVVEKGLLEADAGVFDTGDDTVGVNANKGDDGRAPASDFGLEAPAAGAKFVIGEFIRAGGGALDDVGDAELEVKKKGFFKGGEQARGESAAVKGGPEASGRSGGRWRRCRGRGLRPRRGRRGFWPLDSG